MNIIVVTQKGNSAVPTYRLQKNYDKWKSLPKKVIVTQKGNSVTQKGNFPLPKKVHTKEKRKETITKKNTYPQDFLGFYDKYPRKKEKKKAFNVWIRLSNKQKTSILLAVDNYKKEMELVQREEEKIKLPATFLNRENECWVDYLPENWKEPGTLSAPKKLSRHERMFGDKNEQG